MQAQFIIKAGRKAFAVIPYNEFLRMREIVKDYEYLKTLCKAKSEPGYRKRRPYEVVAKELGLK